MVEQEYGIVLARDPKLQEFERTLRKAKSSRAEIELTSYMSGEKLGSTIDIQIGIN